MPDLGRRQKDEGAQGRSPLPDRRRASAPSDLAGTDRARFRPRTR